MGGEKKSSSMVTVIQFSSYLKIFFLIEKTKNLQMKKNFKMNLVKVQFFTCRFLFSSLGK